MKKLLIAILSIILIICIGMLFVGCGAKNWYHDGHPNIASWVVVKQSTCTEQGEKRFRCQICGKDLGFSYIDQLGHDYSDCKSNGDGTHTKTCTRDSSHVIIEKCSGGSATETDRAICSVCDHPYGQLLGEKQATEGLMFALINNDTEYEVIDYVGTATEVYIPTTYKDLSVTKIGKEAFFGCSTLTSIEIPDNITSIGRGAFGYCSSLEAIEIPNSVNYIGETTFIRCRKLTNIQVLENNNHYKSIEGNLYSKDGTTLIKYAIGKDNSSFVIPSCVTTIGYDAFDSCSSLISVEISNNVEYISEYSFYNCTSLTSIKIGDSVTSIGDYAFSDCDSLTSIIIPSSVIYIDFSLFENCDSLTKVYCQTESKPISWDDYWIYGSDAQVVWGYDVN